jgi:cytochrome P450
VIEVPEGAANMIGLGIVALLREPEQRAILLSDPAEYASIATEEMMR